jgi:outer membrane lipoprotein-sorting protein
MSRFLHEKPLYNLILMPIALNDSLCRLRQIFRRRFAFKFATLPLNGEHTIMIKYFSFLFLLIGATMQTISAQTAETNDAQATKLLDKISKKYDAYKALDLDFSLVVEVPGEKKMTQKGRISQAKEAYRLTMDDQTIISDGKTNWIYLKKNNEVQITDVQVGDKNGLLTPRQLLSMYKGKDYVYAIVDKTTENGVVLTQIEFKPTSKSSEYSKIRLAINEKTGFISSVRAFAKDGSRYAFVVVKHNTAAKHAAMHYTFDKAQFPGARVEDLRM